MIPKEKAKELIDYFKPFVYCHVGSGFMTGDENESLILSNSIKGAIKVVNEVLLNTEHSNQRNYWHNVLKEIQQYNG